MRSSASSRNICFFPELVDVAFLGWVIWEGNGWRTFQARERVQDAFKDIAKGQAD